MTTVIDSESNHLHFLQRATFGPTEAEIEELDRVGIAAYLKQQLNPEGVVDTAAG
jgi:hypothetical protein